MLSLKIAIRFLTSSRLQTTLIIFGIAIAISVQVFVGLLISSLQRSLVEQTIGQSPQITIISSTDINTIRDWENLIRKIEPNQSIKAVSPSASLNTFLSDKDADKPILLKGVIFNSADVIYDLRSTIYEGRLARSRREVIIGKELAEKLEIDVGDRITLVQPGGSTSLFPVSGFYNLGNASINETWIIANLQIAVNDVFEADIVASQLEKSLNNEKLEILNWKDQNEDLLSALDGQRTSSTIIQVVIVLSVVIAIASVLAISVLQKSRQIGILKAIGIKDLSASMIFIYQSLILGMLGSILGISLGIGLLFSFNFFTSNPDGSSLINLYIENSFILRSWLIALFAAVLAGLIPARKSLQLNPINIIREG
jgi:lipoprotein-releasing system permease protein